MLHLKKEQQREAKRIVEYLVTGGAWFWSGYAMFALCYSVLHLDIVPSKVISYLFGLTVNFLLERYWVFHDTRRKHELPQVTARYIVLSGVNLGIDTLIVWGLYKLGMTPYLGQFVSAGFFTVWNYLWYKLWVFAKGAPGPKHQAAPVLRRSKHVRPKHQKRRRQ